MSPNQSIGWALCGTVQAVFTRSRSAGISWNPWRLLPHLLPHELADLSTCPEQAQGTWLPDDAWPLRSIPGGGASGDSSTSE
jgi:hypothetical protein